MSRYRLCFGCPLKDLVVCDINHFFAICDGLLVSKDQWVCYSAVEELCEAMLLLSFMCYI